jgi:protein gp37
MEDPDLWRKAPCTVFVGSMSDIEYWPRENTERIIRDVCKTYYKNTYMFLTKNADSYKGFLWPPNTMQGLTMTKIISQDNCLQLIKMEGVPRPFLSIEPLLGLVGYFPVEKYELVIVGAMTGPGAIKPEPMWIRSVRDTVPKEKIYWKRNIRGYL